MQYNEKEEQKCFSFFMTILKKSCLCYKGVTLITYMVYNKNYEVVFIGGVGIE